MKPTALRLPLLDWRLARGVCRWATLVAVFAITAGLRFLGIQSLSNDHYVHLTGAQQILFGDWPVRDFVDAGTPLMFGMSAAAQAALGRTLFSEAVLIAVMFGLAAALTVAAVREFTGSIAAGVVAAFFVVAIYPRTYGYQKVLAFALCFHLFTAHANRPSVQRLLAVCCGVALVFLLRHDNGVYLGIGGLVAAILSPWPARPADALRRGGLFLGITGVLLLPYFLYVQAVEGLWPYFRHGLEFSAPMGARQAQRWPNPFAEYAPEAALVYVFHALPVAVITWLIVNRHRQDITWIAQRVIPIVVAAVLGNLGLLRSPFAARVPDAVVPAAVLGAWLMAAAWRGNRRAIQIPVSIALSLVAALWIVQLGNTAAQVRKIGVVGQWTRIGERFTERSAELRARFDQHQFPTHAVAALVPFFQYLDRCTTIQHRLFVAGYLPEVPYYAQRPFAGGAYLRENYETSEGQQLVVDRLRHQHAPFALIPSDYAENLRLQFPIVSGFLDSHYSRLTDVRADERLTIRILVNQDYAMAPRDDVTTWPCVIKQQSVREL